MLNRRRFLGLGSAAGVGLTGLGAAARQGAAPAEEPRIRRHVVLGRTGLRVSDISFGSASSTDVNLVRHALDRGVTFFDTAESYRFGWAEEAIGEGLQDVRDKVVIASKTKARTGDRQADMMEALEGSLRRLRTDYVDIYFNHAVNNVARMQNQEWFEFTERAKAQGKIRFTGMSGHGSRLVPCLEYAIDNDLVDVVLVAYSFAQDPGFTDKMRHAFHYVDMQPGLPRVRTEIAAVAAIACILQIGIARQQVEITAADLGLARRGDVFVDPFDRGHRDHDRVHPGAGQDPAKGGLRKGTAFAFEGPHVVETRAHQGLHRNDAHVLFFRLVQDACPDGVAIAEVLRTRMYAVDYGDTVMAKADYAALDGGATQCLTCSHRACLGACPHGLPIPELTRDASTRLG